MAFYRVPLPPQIPDSTLREWLARSFVELGAWLNYGPRSYVEFEQLNQIPDRVQVGTLAYFAPGVQHPSRGGLYLYTQDNTWELVGGG